MEDFGSEIFAIETVLCAGNVVYQAVDKVLQQHSRCTQRLKVWRRVRFAYLHTADLLEGLSGQRTTDATRVCDCPDAHGSAVRKEFVNTLLCAFLSGAAMDDTSLGL